MSIVKTTFINFLSGLGVTIHKVINMLSYTFIIPILEILLNIATSGSLNEKQITEIGIRLASYGFITASSSTIEILIKTIFASGLFLIKSILSLMRFSNSKDSFKV